MISDLQYHDTQYSDRCLVFINIFTLKLFMRVSK